DHDDRTERAAPEGPDPAEDGDQDDLARGGPVQLLQRGESVADGEHPTSQAGQACREDEGDDLVAIDVVPEGTCASRVVPDGHEDPPERGVDDPPGSPDAQQDETDRGVVEVERLGLDRLDAEEALRNTLEAVLPPGQVARLVGYEV